MRVVENVKDSTRNGARRRVFGVFSRRDDTPRERRTSEDAAPLARESACVRKCGQLYRALALMVMVLERLCGQQQRYLGRPVLLPVTVVMVMVVVGVVVPAQGHRAHVCRRIVRTRRVLVVDRRVLDRRLLRYAQSYPVGGPVVHGRHGRQLLEVLVEQQLRRRRRTHEFRVRRGGRRRPAGVRRTRVELLRDQSSTGL